MKGAAAGLSGLAAMVLLLPMEAGVPVPLPADLVMFTVGNGSRRASSRCGWRWPVAG